LTLAEVTPIRRFWRRRRSQLRGPVLKKLIIWRSYVVNASGIYAKAERSRSDLADMTP
jgi:hypothetical protein